MFWYDEHNGIRLEIYVYDAEAIKKEGDDPLNAILFRYPKDLTEENAIFTCGHLMSTIKCCRTLFSESPRSMQLSNGTCELIRDTRFYMFIIARRASGENSFEYQRKTSETGTIGLETKSSLGCIHDINTLCQSLNRELWQSITLFRESLANWYLKCKRKEQFKQQIETFLSMVIGKMLIKYNLKPENTLNDSGSFMKKIQDNRSMKFINLCKQMFEQINMHQSIIGGFVQARVISSHANDGQLEHAWIPIFAYPEMLSSSLIDCLAMGVQQNYKPSSLEYVHAQHTSYNGQEFHLPLGSQSIMLFYQSVIWSDLKRLLQLKLEQLKRSSAEAIKNYDIRNPNFTNSPMGVVANSSRPEYINYDASQMLRDVISQLSICPLTTKEGERFHISSGNDDSTKISSIKSQEAGHFSLYVINVGKLQLVLILSICEEDLKEAFVRNLWNIAITNLPPVETILYD